MAFLHIPPEIENNVESLDLSLDRSHEVAHRNRTGVVSVFRFGDPKWLAVATLFVAKAGDAAAIEAWIAELTDPDNFTDFPLFRTNAGGGLPGGVRTATVTGGSAAAGFTLNRTLATEAGWELQVGDFVRWNQRRFQVVALSGNQLTVTLTPKIHIPPGQVIWLTDHLHAILRPESLPSLPKSASWSGPWTLNLEERIV